MVNLMKFEQKKDYMNIKEISELCGVDPSTVRRWVEKTPVQNAQVINGIESKFSFIELFKY